MEDREGKLLKRVEELEKKQEHIRIIAAGTAVIELKQDSWKKTSVRHPLLERQIVFLSARARRGSYSGPEDAGPFFLPFWRKADGGFEIFVHDLGGQAHKGPVTIDWAVLESPRQ
jgi:hypothetical protein